MPRKKQVADPIEATIEEVEETEVESTEEKATPAMNAEMFKQALEAFVSTPEGREVLTKALSESAAKAKELPLAKSLSDIKRVPLERALGALGLGTLCAGDISVNKIDYPEISRKLKAVSPDMEKSVVEHYNKTRKQVEQSLEGL